MIRKALRFAFSNQNIVQRLPKAPKLLSGQLQNFRLDAQHARIYDGYSLDELYGSKVGIKHSPAVRAQMTKDSIASIFLFVVGFSIIYHLHNLDLQQLRQLQNLNDRRLSRKVELPSHLKNNLQRTQIILDQLQY